jgi:hypothetical protein
MIPPPLRGGVLDHGLTGGRASLAHRLSSDAPPVLTKHANGLAQRSLIGGTGTGPFGPM